MCFWNCKELLGCKCQEYSFSYWLKFFAIASFQWKGQKRILCADNHIVSLHITSDDFAIFMSRDNGIGLML